MRAVDQKQDYHLEWPYEKPEKLAFKLVWLNNSLQLVHKSKSCYNMCN